MDELSLISEQIERTLLTELHRAASEEIKETLGLSLKRTGTATVSLAKNDPTILINRTIGLGVESPATKDEVEAVTKCYASNGIGYYFLHLHPEAEPPELRHWITEAGLRKHRGWMKFSRGTEAPPDIKSELAVRQIGKEHAMDFGRIAAAGFDMTDSAVPLIAAFVEKPGWYLYMSFAGETPAGTGALFVKDGVAWFDWAATDAAFRGKGGQGIVLCERIKAAIDLGCTLMLTETGEAIEGDPQHSYNNIMRMGFREACLRENYVPSL
jgi:hypothetical protein